MPALPKSRPFTPRTKQTMTDNRKLFTKLGTVASLPVSIVRWRRRKEEERHFRYPPLASIYLTNALSIKIGWCPTNDQSPPPANVCQVSVVRSLMMVPFSVCPLPRWDLALFFSFSLTLIVMALVVTSICSPPDNALLGMAQCYRQRRSFLFISQNTSTSFVYLHMFLLSWSRYISCYFYFSLFNCLKINCPDFFSSCLLNYCILIIAISDWTYFLL